MLAQKPMIILRMLKHAGRACPQLQSSIIDAGGFEIIITWARKVLRELKTTMEVPMKEEVKGQRGQEVGLQRHRWHLRRPI